MTNIPAKLVAEFATISDRIEEAIRQDERHKVLTQLASEREAGARAFLDAVFADRNGEQTDKAAKSVRQRRGFIPAASSASFIVALPVAPTR